jgi:hypothetical protein
MNGYGKNTTIAFNYDVKKKNNKNNWLRMNGANMNQNQA